MYLRLLKTSLRHRQNHSRRAEPPLLQWKLPLLSWKWWKFPTTSTKKTENAVAPEHHFQCRGLTVHNFLRTYGMAFCCSQVSKKSFADVAALLDRAKRPTRLTFVRHACGRRFVSREKDGGFAAAAQEIPGRTAFGLRRRGKRGKAGRGYEQLLCAGSAGRADPRSSSLSPQKSTKCYRQIEVGPEWVVVAPVCCQKSAATWGHASYRRKRALLP